MAEHQASLPKSITLPADPDEQNDDRSEWAEIALLAFMGQTRTDVGDAVSDLLADMMHWCDRNGIDFGSELERAQEHYKEETLPVA